MSDRLKTSIERAKFHGLLETAQFLQEQADLIKELEENINLKADFIERTINASATDYERLVIAEQALRDIADMSVVCASDRAVVALKQFVELDTH